MLVICFTLCAVGNKLLLCMLKVRVNLVHFVINYDSKHVFYSLIERNNIVSVLRLFIMNHNTTNQREI